MPPLDTNNDGSSSNGGGVGGEAIEVIDLVELAETSHALLQVCEGDSCVDAGSMRSAVERTRRYSLTVVCCVFVSKPPCFPGEHSRHNAWSNRQGRNRLC